MIEIARSFSMKRNLGNYETADFFASAKKEVPEKDAEKTSEALYLFARAEVIKSINQFMGKTPHEAREEVKKEVTGQGKPSNKGRSPAEWKDIGQTAREGTMADIANEEN